jgi:hypothetical protein
MPESFTPHRFQNGQHKEVTITGDVDLTPYHPDLVQFQQDGQPSSASWSYSGYHVQQNPTVAKMKVKASAVFGSKLDPATGALTITLTGGGKDVDLPVGPEKVTVDQ